MKTRRAGLILACVAAVLAASLNHALAGADWPGFRGPTRDGKSPDKGLLKEWPAGGPTLLWKAQGIGKGFSSVAVSGAKVYITGDVGENLVVSAFDLAGKLQWKKPAGGACKNDPPGARSTPTIDGARLYLLSADGRLSCLDAATGERVWARESGEFGGSPGGWGYAESVLVDGDRVVFKPGGPNFLAALDKTSGTTVWQSQGYSAGPEYSSCLRFTAGGAPFIVTGASKGIVCVRASDGQVRWSNGFSADNTANCPTPVFSDNFVFWANGYGKGGICMRLTADGGAEEAWTTRDMDCHHGGYIVDHGYIYGNHGGGWACLELKSGLKKWQHQGPGKGSLCWADGMLYLFSENSGQAALATCSPDGLVIKGRLKVEGSGPSWAHPVVIGGQLYLRYDSNLYCFDVKKK
jgi:outer membrane protein assembly factor BamB